MSYDLRIAVKVDGTDTPYLVQEFKRGYPMMIDLDFAGLTRQKVIDYLNEYVDSL